MIYEIPSVYLNEIEGNTKIYGFFFENYEFIDSQGKKRIEFRKTRSYTLTNTLNEDFAKNKKMH